jgi:hypothetical protein
MKKAILAFFAIFLLLTGCFGANYQHISQFTDRRIEILDEIFQLDFPKGMEFIEATYRIGQSLNDDDFWALARYDHKMFDKHMSDLSFQSNWITAATGNLMIPNYLTIGGNRIKLAKAYMKNEKSIYFVDDGNLDLIVFRADRYLIPDELFE